MIKTSITNSFRTNSCLKTNNKYERDQVLLNWIKTYGEIKECVKCKITQKDEFIKPDMLWFSDFDLDATLKTHLNYIYQNRHQGAHFYIDVDYAGNPKFTNENPYYSWSYDESGFKLLALYRY